MDHLNIDKILSYVENQVKDIDKVEIHIATCERCHGIYMGLKSVEETLSHSFKDGKATDSCPEDWEIGALVSEELPSDISDKISKHIKDCGFCIDRAVGYYKSLELMEKEKTPARDTPFMEI